MFANRARLLGRDRGMEKGRKDYIRRTLPSEASGEKDGQA